MLLLSSTVYDEMFYHFPLFHETLRHIKLCNIVISHIKRNPLKLLMYVGNSLFSEFHCQNSSRYSGRYYPYISA